MLCQKCKQNSATARVHYVKNGIVCEMYLCPDCADEFKMHNFYDEDVLNIISSMFNNASIKPKNILKCELCGTDFDEIKATGRVGCSNCYKVFEKQFASTLLRLHGKTRHVGKIPNRIIENSIKKEQDGGQTELEALKNKLAEAILREEYEKAAVIRDEIRKREA